MFNFEVCAYLSEADQRIKFEPVGAKRRSRSSGTQISEKRGRFEIASTETCFYQQTINDCHTSGHIGRKF